MRREIISRETIKPSSPTPPHLKYYKLSLLDQIAPPIHVTFVLFFPNSHSQQRHHRLSEFPNKLQHLKNSLSSTLSYYPPLAGRINDRLSIRCNDDGVEVFECRIDCQMSEILADPYTGNKLKSLLPSNELLDMTSRLLSVQVTLFGCGGVSIGVSISHVIGDASTITAFIKDWAKKTRSSPDREIGISPPPKFNAATIFPPLTTSYKKDSSLPIPPAAKLEVGKRVVAKRYVFTSSNIQSLNEMAAGGQGRNPTRVELVTALILKSATAAAATTNSGRLKKTFAFQAVDLRRRMIPPLPETSMGNIVWSFPVEIATEEEKGFRSVVERLREGMQRLNKLEVLKSRSGEKWSSFIIRETLKKIENLVKNKDDCQVYKFTSWCRFGMYEDDVDLGWGKVAWMGMGNADYKNFIVLNDCSNGDGIEAMIILEEDDMGLFERNPDIIAYTTTTP